MRKNRHRQKQMNAQIRLKPLEKYELALFNKISRICFSASFLNINKHWFNNILIDQETWAASKYTQAHLERPNLGLGVKVH